MAEVDGMPDRCVRAFLLSMLFADMIQIVNFLEKMAREVDLEELPLPSDQKSISATNGNSSYKSPFVYEPTRRKLHLP